MDEFILIKPEDLIKVQAQIAVSMDLYSHLNNPDIDIDDFTKKHIAEGIGMKLLEDNLIDFDISTDNALGATIYKGSIKLYKKKKSEE